MRQTLTAYLISPWSIKGGIMRAPVTLIQEGVHDGSQGPVFWAGHILQENAHKWENVPVCLNHPQVDGNFVSIHHTPQIRNTAIGIVTDPIYDPVKKAIKATIQIPANNPRISEIQNIREVSMGVFSDETYEIGTWSGERYKSCSISMEPDHLALLPEDEGACSWSDGCGIRANARAASNINSLAAGGSKMTTVKPLLPPGVEEQAEGENETWQGPGVEPLLPTGVEERPKAKEESKTWQGKGVEPLLPTGMN